MLVTLVGAGPGDVGLLTLKGAEALQAADVVLFDRFVGPEILALIPAQAERINVGKTAGNHPVPQAEINRLLMDKALQGLNVVRLKGGDPFVFGRGGEELELLVENGIPFEVVPGVTSAIAGLAYAGIPVTHRDYASSVHFITSQAKNNEEPNINFSALVDGGGTLVFLMGVSALEAIVKGLLVAGMSEKTPAAVVENATLAQQRKIVSDLAGLSAAARAAQIVSPALIVVGDVCALSDDYDWFSALPLHGRRILVPRLDAKPSRLAKGLRKQGAEAMELLLGELKAAEDIKQLIESTCQAIEEFDWLVFTSAFGVTVFFDQVIASGIDIRSLQHLKVASVGSETTRQLQAYGIGVAYQPGEYNGEALAEGLAELVSPDEKLILARAADGASGLPDTLGRHQLSFADLPLYHRSTLDGAVGLQSLPDFDLVAFTSSSGVEGLVQAAAAQGIGLASAKALCIGKTTAQTAIAAGMDVSQSDQATIDSLIAKAVELLGNS
ncbi:MAG: uroporphyrinogen-III C-methyltransferase [Coriobacteriia bacterium]|nr:uroporphyrinogen-III C-methyltransferase [Coriobacteriia bacterium]